MHATSEMSVRLIREAATVEVLQFTPDGTPLVVVWVCMAPLIERACNEALRRLKNRKKWKKLGFLSLLAGAPGASRTRDRPLRRRMLYPAELRAPTDRTFLTRAGFGNPAVDSRPLGHRATGQAQIR